MLVVTIVVYAGLMFGIPRIADRMYYGSDETLPTGYSWVFSTEGAKVSFRFPDGRISANVWDSKVKAAHFARYWESRYISESDRYEWIDE